MEDEQGDKMKVKLNQRKDSQSLMKMLLGQYLSQDWLLYDIGCGEKPFGPFLAGKVARHVGVDVDNGFYDAKFIDLIGSADNLPIETGTADAIVSSMVIEHLPDPARSISECARVLKPGGILFLSYPYLYPIHAAPNDFFRMSPFAIDQLFKEHGFELIERHTLGGFWYMLGSLMPIYLQGLPPIKFFKLGRPVGWITRIFFYIIHLIEGLTLRILKKDVMRARSAWAVTYVLAARRRAKT